MKYLFLVIALFIGPVCMAHSDENFIKSDLFGNLGERDKAAILIIHFGTTHDDTRVLTIDAINAKMKEAFPGIEVREAWTSRIILKKLKERGVERLNPTCFRSHSGHPQPVPLRRVPPPAAHIHDRCSGIHLCKQKGSLLLLFQNDNRYPLSSGHRLPLHFRMKSVLTDCVIIAYRSPA